MPVAGGRDLLRAGLAARAHRRQPGGHGLDVGDAEGLVDAGHDEHVPGASAGQRLLAGQLPGELDAVGHAQLAGQPRQRLALGAVADDEVAQLRVALAQQPQRAHDVGVALARDEVRDGDEGGVGLLVRRLLGDVGAQVHHARGARAQARAPRPRCPPSWPARAARRRRRGARRARRRG